MKPKKLTKDQEGEIAAALTKVAELVEGGSSPDDALFKVAAEQQFPAGHVRLMAQAYNNGRSLGQIRTGTNLVEKAAEFPLADAGAVLERMFPGSPQTAAALQKESAVSDDYELPPDYWLKRLAAQKQAASVQLPPMEGTKELEPYPETPGRAGLRALNEVAKLRKEAEDMRADTYSAGYKVVASLDALRDYFRQSDRLPFNQVEKNASTIFGQRAVNILHRIKQKNLWLKKEASDRAHPVNRKVAPYSLINDCLHAVDSFDIAKQAMENFEMEASEKSAKSLCPFFQVEKTAVIRGSVWDAQSSMTKESLGIVGAGIAGLAGGSGRGLAEALIPDPEKTVQKKMESFNDREHEEVIRGIRTQALLHDLMTNDPIISGYEPNQVAEAYNRISEVAPQASQRRLIAQQLIRKYLEQEAAIDPFESQQLLDMEQKIKGKSTLQSTPNVATAG
jgi:hypothetical protein